MERLGWLAPRFEIMHAILNVVITWTTAFAAFGAVVIGSSLFIMATTLLL